MLKNQPNFAEQWHDIEAFLKGTEAFIAHNAQFDKGVLYGTANAYAIRPPEIPFYCTLKGSRKFLQLQRLANKSAASPCTFRRRGMR